jgi:hypothetical protein
MTILDIETLTTLKNVISTLQDSKKAILEFDGDYSSVEEMEELSIRIYLYFHNKSPILDALLFIHTFELEISIVQGYVKSLKEAIGLLIKNEEKIQTVCHLVLKIGNYLN